MNLLLKIRCVIPKPRRLSIFYFHGRYRGYSSVKISANTYDVTSYFAEDSPEYKHVKALEKGIIEKDRASLARSITLVESSNEKKKMMGQLLLQHVLSYMKSFQNHKTFRIGLSGPPGAGKSTFIETLGQYLTEREGLKVAVLAVDPSSSRTGGSLLGDRTRMIELSRNPNAYIRPSPAKGTLGGVTRTTTEAMLLCECAGYDVVIVETVGVGQSEVAVADMTDVFLLLVPPASGDELQGIKRGIVEIVDFVVVNKADGDLLPAARRMQTEYISALKFIPRKHKFWRPRVRRISSLMDGGGKEFWKSLAMSGIPELWENVQQFRTVLEENGELDRIRKKQRTIWMWNHISNDVLQRFKENKDVSKNLAELEDLVENGKMTPGLASDLLLNFVFKNNGNGS